MTADEIIDSGQVDERLVDQATLAEATSRVARLIKTMQGIDTLGPIGEAMKKKYLGLYDRLLALQNQRRGVDGMTPLSG